MKRLAAAGLVLLGAASLAVMAAPGCDSPSSTVPQACANGGTCQVRLTILHTSDIHSRLLPYDLLLTQVDSNLGLGSVGSVKNVGGVARVSYVLNRERARSDRVLHLDSGDCFEGAPIFNYFNGEPEVRAQSMMGTDAMVIGNHEFDHGALNAALQFQKWANFPFLAANYKLETVNQASNSQLSNVLAPFTLFNVEGLKIAVIGMANISSLSSIFDQPNSANITALNTIETAQFYVDLLRPAVDVIVMLSHLGLTPDEDMVRHTTGIDVVMGGHNHIVIDPPESLQDCSADPQNPGFIWVVDPNYPYDPGATPPNDAVHPDPVFHPFQMHRACKPRNVLIQHSGAFAKYVGRLDLVLSNDRTQVSPTGNPDDYEPINGFEVVSNKYVAFPIDATVPEDPVMVDLLQPYIRGLNRAVDLNILVGFAPQAIQRFAPQGGDSPLGNLISKAMWFRLGVQTDFAMTNSTGIRTDLANGPVNVEEMFNIFPFDNTITKMQLSGLEVYDMFDFIARRSSSRGCQSQAQIAGARVRLNCAGCNRPGAAPPCVADSDCISAGANGCDQNTHTCVITSCADQVYIGYTTQDCNTDADCPNQLPASCDISLPLGKRKCLQPIENTNLYELATNNYLAQGGSGFRTLQRNTTQLDTKIAQRDAVIDYMRQGKPCGYSAANATPEGLKACGVDSDCADQGDFVCQCVGQTMESGSGANATCPSVGACDAAVGRCVLRACRDGVAAFHDRLCSDSTNAALCEAQLNSCELAGEECKVIACVDASLGATTDNRVEMIGR
jgi:5'-nucleotidase